MKFYHRTSANSRVTPEQELHNGWGRGTFGRFADTLVLLVLGVAPLLFSVKVLNAFGDVKFPVVALGAAGLGMVPAVAIALARPSALFHRRGSLALWALLLFAVWALFSQTWAYNRELGLKWVAFLAGCAGLFCIGLLRLKMDALVFTRKVVVVVAVVTALAGTYGLVQRMGFQLLSLVGLSSEATKYQGKFVVSTFGNGVFTAQYMAVAAPLLLFGAFAWQGMRRVFILVSASVGVACLIATQGRAGALGFVAALLIVGVAVAARHLIRSPRRDWKQIGRWALASVILAGILAAGAYQSGLMDRFVLRPGSAQWVSTTYRKNIYRDSAKLVLQRPVTGFGYGNFDIAIPLTQGRGLLVAQQNIEGNERVNRAHNEWLDTAAETGVVGLVLLLMVSGVVLWSCGKLIYGSALERGIAGALISGGVMTFVDFPLHTPATAPLIWSLAGLAIATSGGAPPLGAMGWVAQPAGRFIRNMGMALAVLTALAATTATSFLWQKNLVSKALLRQAWEAKQLRDPAREFEFLSRAAVAFPNDRDVLEMLSTFLVSVNRTQEAEAIIRRWLQFDPSLSSAYNMLGSVLAQKGVYEEAVTQFQNAQRLSPNNIQAWMNEGLLHHAKGEHARAFPALWKAFTIDQETARPAVVPMMESARESKNWDNGLEVANWYLAHEGRTAGVDKQVWFIRRQLIVAQQKARPREITRGTKATPVKAAGETSTTAEASGTTGI
jgi:O-antigen ligase/Tfp pilus assembly protein PilF